MFLAILQGQLEGILVLVKFLHFFYYPFEGSCNFVDIFTGSVVDIFTGGAMAIFKIFISKSILPFNRPSEISFILLVFFHNSPLFWDDLLL